jgi:hypothetical protein
LEVINCKRLIYSAILDNQFFKTKDFKVKSQKKYNYSVRFF